METVEQTKKKRRKKQQNHTESIGRHFNFSFTCENT